MTVAKAHYVVSSVAPQSFPYSAHHRREGCMIEKQEQLGSSSRRSPQPPATWQKEYGTQTTMSPHIAPIYSLAFFWSNGLFW